MVYFDNAATTAMSDVALNALVDVSKEHYGNPSSAYGFGRKSKKILEEAREIIADCIGAESNEIVFTSCGTESDNWALRHGGIKLRRIITTEIEHHAVLYPAKQLSDIGVTVEYLKPNEKCEITAQQLLQHLNGTPAMVSVMYQNNETGVIQDISEIARIVHDDNSKSIVHTDAVQAVGHTRIDVHEMDIDMLSASAHKFNGPKGIGFLYVKNGFSVEPLILGGGQEHGMRSGTENVAGIYAMAKALEDNNNNVDIIHRHIASLEKNLLDRLRKEGIDFVINGDSEKRATGVLNIAFKGLDGEGLLNMLDMHNICISIGSACNSKSQDRSHVLRAMGVSDDIIDSSIRISIGRYNTEDDVEQLVKNIAKFRKASLLVE